MRSIRVSTIHPEPARIEEALQVLREGGIVAFPTDTLYGLTCDPRNRMALGTLFDLKARPSVLRLPFIAASTAQAEELVSLESEPARKLVESFWPGPLTLILPLIRADRLASWPWGDTLAIRVPASPVARELARGAGIPIPATSANLSGKTPASQPVDLDPGLVTGVTLLLDGGPLEGNLPSTLLDLTSSPPRLIRQGAISRGSLEALPGLPPLAGETT